MNLRELGRQLTKEATSQKLSAFIALMHVYGVEFETDEQAADLLKTIQEL